MEQRDLTANTQNTRRYCGVPTALISKMLDLIEESGISNFEAEMVPDFLRLEIKMCIDSANQEHRFTVPKE